jgi:replicative DNA helicase
VIDRLPPHSLEAEQSVLGAILIDRETIIEIAEFLRPEDFYRQAHGSIYRAMLELFERREPVDLVTVAESLERSEDLEQVGGRSYLSQLSNQTPTAVHAVQYARIVERKAVLRNLIGAAGKIAGIGYEDPAEIQEAIDRAESELFNVSNRRITAGFNQLRDLLHSAYDRSTTCTPTAASSAGSRPGSSTWTS